MAFFPAKTVSGLVQAYPFRRGRHRLRTFAASKFLVGRTDAGHWVRVSGVSGFEWKILDGNINERRTAEFFRQVIAPRMVVIDVGANIGYYSLLAAALVGPEGQVHAFEPTPAVASRLRENLAMNGFLSNVWCNESAAGEGPGILQLYLHKDDAEGNSVFPSTEHDKAVSVPVVALDDYVRQHGIDRVDLLKIDAEGAEPMVLRGAKGLLSRDDAPVCVIESNPLALGLAGATTQQLLRVLENHGYSCWELEQLTTHANPVVNVVAVKSSQDARIEMVTRLGLQTSRPAYGSGVSCVASGAGFA